ncbi:NADH dehydrogenase [ubiquinone] flavoprotein 3, mitochondrial [Acanthochromis polyacanthus]|uniref:NADH dehydrogenase [ubiquinone] flavoprotein 3, mitochondrial n=1 Tax=Acanthochromis polyacanthus TaxID=80966 RepID=UPI0022340751|nr:NADH dehydrogenase [ubiquinone] flavoprotein 3, mitochondrial [Acanthochromis polyacanthus]
MAASMLRVGRLGSLKCLQLESWGILRSRPAAFFCTQVEEPPKPAKKAKAAGKKSAEQLVDCAPVVAEAAEEELQVEAPAEQSEEATTTVHVEPEEHFDNSTYKNYQHHSYTPYTFADLDVEMAKFRLPQPSSGRPSPRH